MGSSPHTRDKSGRSLAIFLNGRIIPAYAGQISPLCSRCLCYWDHPRIRGTNNISLKDSFSDEGSSPHTRDKLSSTSFGGFFCRIIPAYAGQIFRVVQIGFIYEDHPRIRGTNKSSFLANNFNQGSSPHTRDKYSSD